MINHTGERILDGTDGWALSCRIVEPAGLEHLDCEGTSQRPIPGGYHAPMTGMFANAVLRRLSDGSSSGPLTLTGDSMALSGKLMDSDIRLRRVVPIIERVEIPDDVQAGLTAAVMRDRWAAYKRNGRWIGSAALWLKLRGIDLPPARISPGLVTPDDPKMELSYAKTGPDGALDIAFHLHEGIEPGRKRVTIAGGAAFSFDLRIEGLEGNPPKPEPQILEIAVLDDQEKLVYPPERSPLRATTLRRLFVAGIGLPKTRTQALAAKYGGEATVDYRFEATAGDAGADFRRGWELTGLSPSDDVSGLIVSATLKRDVRPGLRTLTIDGGPGVWPLAFADGKGSLEFVRYVRDQGDETTLTVLAGETFHIDAWTDAVLPLEEIPLEVRAFGPGGEATSEVIGLTARKVAGAGKPVKYRSGPLAIEAGILGVPPQKGVTVIPGKGGGSLIVRGADPDLVRFLPESSSADIVHTPADLGATWDEYLQLAASCAGMTLEEARKNLTHKVADASRFIISFKPSDIGRESVNIAIGDHAGALVLRNAFRDKMKALRAQYQRILANSRAVRGFRIEMARRANDNRQPINQIRITDVDGSETYYSDIHRPKGPAAALTPEARTAWQDKATRQALEKLLEAMETAIAYADAESACEVERWVMMTSLGFDKVVEQILPGLMKEAVAADGSTVWQPDVVARAYVKGVAQLGASIRGLEEYQRTARGLTAFVMLPAFFASGAIFASEGAFAYFLGLAVTAVDIAITAADLIDYAATREDIAFSTGAAPVIGLDRVEIVAGAASGPIAAAVSVFGVVAPGLGAVSSRLGKVAAARALSAAATRGEKLARTRAFTREAIAAMSAAERADSAAYFAQLKAKEIAEGSGSLTAAERRFVDSIHTRMSEGPIFPDIVASAPSRPGGRLSGSAVKVDGETLHLGGRLGSGGYNDVYAATGREDLVVRVAKTDDRVNQGVEIFARNAFDKEGQLVKSGHIPPIDESLVRLPVRKGSGVGQKGSAMEGRPYEVLERMPQGSVRDMLRGGPMTPGQAAAIHDGFRELNRAGLACTDCKLDNIALVARKGPDQWTLVMMDTGGLVPAAGRTLAERAANATAIQKTFADTPAGLAAAYRKARAGGPQAAKDLELYTASEKARVRREIGNRIDYDRLHEASGSPDAGYVATTFGSIDQASVNRLLRANDPAAEMAEIRAEWNATRPRRRPAPRRSMGIGRGMARRVPGGARFRHAA